MLQRDKDYFMEPAMLETGHLY